MPQDRPKSAPRPAATRLEPQPWTEGSPGPDDVSRRGFPFETVIQDVIRRAASLGLSSFFLTEEALRRAFNDTVPRDWVDYVNRQGDEIRDDLIQQLATEFRAWLAGVDAAELIGQLLESHEITATIQLSARPRAGGGDASSGTPDD